ncbi:MAG: YncE family protein [Halobacteriales archaeon]
MPDDVLVVLDKDDDTLSILDAETGERRRTVDTAFNPHEVAVGPAGERVYVSCSLGERLLVYDAETFEVLERIEHELFDFPHGLAVRASAGELWLVATYSSQVFVFDLETANLLTDFATGEEMSHMVALDDAEERAYIANIGGDSVTLVDCEDREILEHAPVGEGPEGIAVHPEAGVLVANQHDGILSVLDPATLEERSRSPLGTTPVRVVPSPDDGVVLVANRESNDVSVVDPAFDRGGEVRPWEVERIPVGIWPGGTTFAPDGATAYVANNKTNDVSVIDVAERAQVDRYEAGTHPDGIAYLER